MALEYLIYADESSSSGSFFSNFYGGILIKSTDVDRVRDQLTAKKQELGLFGEVKWSKVTAQYLPRYIELMSTFFDFISDGTIKARIMFTHNFQRPVGLTSEHRQNRYHILYYHFIKHAFGLPYSNPGLAPRIGLRVFFDELPGTKEQNAVLKGFVAALRESAPFRRAGIWIESSNIVEVRSHEHVLLQCLDVALGAVHFRLNDKHLAKPEGARQRGKRTLAKEKLYKLLNSRIRTIYPGFNIGISTGLRGDPANLWLDSYRHWCFQPREFALDHSKTKKG